MRRQAAVLTRRAGAPSRWPTRSRHGDERVNEGQLAGKTALVTGAAQGLGAGIARALAREGARVLVTDRNGEGAAEVAATIGEAASAMTLDVTDEAGWIAAVAEARELFGGLSILVNNAGIVTMGSVEELSLADWRRAMAVNADSAFLGCKIALPLLRDGQPASIVTCRRSRRWSPRTTWQRTMRARRRCGC